MFTSNARPPPKHGWQQRYESEATTGAIIWQGDLKMRRTSMLAGVVTAVLSIPPVFGQVGDLVCGTPGASLDVDRLYMESFRRDEPPSVKSHAPIPIAFHVIHDGRNGKVTLEQINVLIHNLNWAFEGTPFSFYLYSADSSKNRSWYGSCAPGSKNELKMKSKLAKDTRRILNFYSCKPGVTIPGTGTVTGFAYLPHMLANGDKRHGVVIHPNVMPGGALLGFQFPYGLTGVHEVGHFLGLWHTFQYGCSDPGDGVADTPPQATPHSGACPIGIDTCADVAGPDDVPNFMSYSTDECMDHFTPEQIAVMDWATRTFRPNL